VSVRIDPGKLSDEEVYVEMIIGARDDNGFVGKPDTVPLRGTARTQDGIVTYAAEYFVRQNGSYTYGIRVMPRHKDLASKLETGLVLWG
jgi:phosphorylase/glycogen(starch) synthase